MDKREQFSLIKQYTAKVLAKDTSGHSLDHIERVLRLARKIGEREDCDLFLVEAGAYLHDVIDDKLVPDVNSARQQLIEFLQEIGFTPEKISALFEIIDNVSFSNSLEKESVELTIEAQIVQDADRLDATGAIGIARTFYYGGYAGHQLYDPLIPPRKKMTKAEYRVSQTVINHFYEKLLLLPGQLNRPFAKEIGEERKVVMENFLAAFKKEWSGD